MPEAAIIGVALLKEFLKVSQNLQEKTGTGIIFLMRFIKKKVYELY